MFPFFMKPKPVLTDEDYYEYKWLAISGFYWYVDDGDDYNLAMAKFLYYAHYYNRPIDDLDHMVTVLTLVARLKRLQHEIPKDILPEAEKAVQLYTKQHRRFRRLGKEEAADLEADFIVTRDALQK